MHNNSILNNFIGAVPRISRMNHLKKQAKSDEEIIWDIVPVNLSKISLINLSKYRNLIILHRYILIAKF